MTKPSALRSSAGAVWALAFIAAGISATAFIVHVGALSALRTPHLQWWTIALGFAVAERAVIHFHFRRSAHSFTLGDIPMVLGLIFASAPQLLLGALLGSCVTWVLDRRLPPLKVVFNLAQLALAVTVAETIVHALAARGHSIGPTDWAVIFLGVETGTLVSVTLIGTAIGLTEGKLPEGMVRQMLTLDLALTATNTALALVAAIVIRTDAAAVPLMLIPAAVVYLAYRAYLTERQRHERVAFLYEATRTLSRSTDVLAALEDLLARSRDAFRVELAEIVLFSGEGQAPLRISLPSSGDPDIMVPLDAGIADDLRRLVPDDAAVATMTPPCGSARLDAYLEARGVTNAMLALLPGDEHVVGTLMLANRVGVVRSFDADDLKLIDAVANNTSVALQFDRLEQAVWQLRDLQEQLQHQASHDPLTSLANRSMFVTRVKDALESEGDSIALLFLDVDDFKAINDTLGHAAGDELLIAIAQHLRGCVLPGDLIARLGGDEFAILLSDVAEPEVAGRAVADRVIDGLSAPISAGGRRTTVKISVGIATGRGGYEQADEIIRNADLAMYEAKRHGCGGAEVFEPHMRSAVIQRHNLRAELERALEQGQLSVDYQPIFSLTTGNVVAAEALVRWQRNYGNVMMPSEFLPLAEETGLIVGLGEFVLADAGRRGRDWLGRGALERDIAVHVNVSDTELEEPTLVSRVTDVLDQTGLPPSLLVLEVNERVVLRESVRVATNLRELHATGVRLALDDFGTGQSSLSYLRTLPFDTLKIARPLVEDITHGAQNLSFVRMVKELSDTLGLRTVAKGIETQEQLDLLTELGCDLGQGFLLSRPAPGGSIPAARFVLPKRGRSDRLWKVVEGGGQAPLT